MIWNIIIVGILLGVGYNIVKYYLNPKYYIVKVIEDKEKEYYVIKRKTSLYELWFNRIGYYYANYTNYSYRDWADDIEYAKKFTSTDNTIPEDAIKILNQLRRKGIETKKIKI